MRKSLYGILAMLAIPFAFSGCGDDSSPSSSSGSQQTSSTLTAQDKQFVSALNQSLVSYTGMTDAYSSMAQGFGTGFASSFAPTAGRKLSSDCNLDTSFTEAGMTISMRATKANGSPLTCAEAGNEFVTSGIGIQMTMSMTQQDMTMDMTMAMVYVPVGTAGGYNATVTMAIDVSSQGMTFAIDPFTMTLTATNADAEPTIAGRMTMTINGLTIENVAIDAEGIVMPQVIRITKSGTLVATLAIGADGSAIAYDADGNVITG